MTEDTELPPAHVDQITPAFITGRLYAAGLLSRGTVTSVEAERLGAHASYNAQLFRLHLHYSHAEVRAPRSLVAKLPTISRDLHERAAILQPGAKENWFYEHVASDTPLSVSHCYYNAIDPNSGGSILLLEDLVVAQVGSQTKGISARGSLLALQSLARFHATWWSSEAQMKLPGFIRQSEQADAVVELVDDIYAVAWPWFLESGIVRIPEEVNRLGSYLVGRLARLDALLDNVTKTLIHGDFRLENVLWGSPSNEARCWVIDWEDISLTSGMLDVAWFLGGGLRIEDGNRERDLIHHYHQALFEAGVVGYTREQCFADYRLAMCSCFVEGILTVAATINSRHQAKLAHAVAERFVAACERLQLTGLLPM